MFFEENLIGPVLLFVLVAAATALMILSSMTKPEILRHKQLANEAGVHMDSSDRDEDDEDKEDGQSADGWDGSADGVRRRRRRQVYKAVSGALWMLTVVAYLAASFITGGWAYTWLIFLMAAAVDNIIKAAFDLVS